MGNRKDKNKAKNDFFSALIDISEYCESGFTRDDLVDCSKRILTFSYRSITKSNINEVNTKIMKKGRLL